MTEEKEHEFDVNEFDALLSKFISSYQSTVVWFNPTTKELKDYSHKKFFMLSDEDIEDIQKIKQQEEDVKRKDYLKDRIRQIQDEMVEDHINNFLDNAKPHASSSEKLNLKVKIKNALRKSEDKYDFDELKALIELVLAGNYENYEKKTQKNSIWSKILSYGWSCIVGIISVFVILIILNSTYDDNQKITYAILILIYLSVQSFSTTFGYLFVNQSNGLYGEFKRVRTLLNNEPTEQENRKYEESQAVINKAMIKSGINGVFLFIGYIITLFTLFGAL